MNAPPTTHPTDQTLQSYGMGTLDDLLVEVVSKHLDSCSDCRRRVAELSSDSFLGKLRAAQGPGSPSRPAAGPSSSAPSLSETLPPGLANHPDYEILRELGRGGMGVVYLAQNKLMGRHEVLKVVSGHLVNRPGVMERFLGEIRNAARLHHPNIVTAYSALRFDENLVLAMEYVEGLDLDKTVKAKGPLPVVHACYFIHQVAQGLQHAHENGMVHRDIKPDNLMLVRLGNRAVVKILDFGLAKVRRERTADGALTAAGQWLGTPDFIAPEQIHDARQADIRADIYSLGCTFYYLLTGRPPFQATTLYEIYQAHHSMDAPLLNTMRPDVPMELAILVATMMAKEPERRFQTPREVSQALAPFLKKENSPASQSKPELSVGGATMPHPQSAPTGRVPTQPATNGSPAPALPAQAGSSWDTLIETQPEASLSDEVRAVREGRGVPQWLWPVAAAALLLVGLGVGWGLRNVPKASETSSVPPPSPARSVATVDRAGPARKAPEVSTREEVPPDSSAPKPTSSGSMRANRNGKVASNSDVEDSGPAAENSQDATKATAKEEPADTEPATTRTVAVAPKAKPAAETPSGDSSQESLLAKRGLNKVGLFYVVATEKEVVAGFDKVVPYYNVMEVAYNELDQALRIENYAQQVDDTRINLIAYINDLNATLANTPNTIVNRLARQGLQQDIQAAQANLGNANREFALAIKRVVPPQKKQALIKEFQKRRLDFLEATKAFKPTVDKAMQEYNELKKDADVTNAIKAIKERDRAPIAMGPSAFFRKAVDQVRKAEQMVSFNPDTYNRRKKKRLEQGTKGKMPSMPSKTDG
jgi:serine/threonine protein kinase